MRTSMGLTTSALRTGGMRVMEVDVELRDRDWGLLHAWSTEGRLSVPSYKKIHR